MLQRESIVSEAFGNWHRKGTREEHTVYRLTHSANQLVPHPTIGCSTVPARQNAGVRAVARRTYPQNLRSVYVLDLLANGSGHIVYGSPFPRPVGTQTIARVALKCPLP